MRRGKEFQSIEQLFEKDTNRHRLEQEHYDKLVKRILDQLAKKVDAASSFDDEKSFEYHFTPLSFVGYNDDRCITYVLDQIRNLDFMADFLPESRKFYISWEHYVPEYKRDIILKKTGIVVDKFGCFVRNIHDQDPETLRQMEREQARQLLELRKRELEEAQFKQLGNRGVYNDSMLESLRHVYQQRRK